MEPYCILCAEKLGEERHTDNFSCTHCKPELEPSNRVKHIVSILALIILAFAAWVSFQNF